MDTSETTIACIRISNDVISKMRSKVGSNEGLHQSLLNNIHGTWLRKMIESGVISEAILPSSASIPFLSPEIVHALRETQDTNPLPGNAASGVDIDAQLPSTDPMMSTKNDIPQKDGSGDGDAVTKPDTKAPYDEDDEDLNENDDVEEEGVDDDNIPYLIICQFDNVRRKKGTNKWDSKFKAGFMQINGKEILFSEAKADFDF